MVSSILTLDIATCTGWAYWRRDQPISYGEFTVAKAGTDIGPFIANFRWWLTERVSDLAPEAVMFEAPILRGDTQLATIRKLYSLAGVAEEIAYLADIGLIREAQPSTVAKHFIGHGRLPRAQKKAETIKACRARGWDPQTDDAADALAILDYAMHIWKIADWTQGGPLFVGKGEDKLYKQGVCQYCDVTMFGRDPAPRSICHDCERARLPMFKGLPFLPEESTWIVERAIEGWNSSRIASAMGRTATAIRAHLQALRRIGRGVYIQEPDKRPTVDEIYARDRSMGLHY